MQNIYILGLYYIYIYIILGTLYAVTLRKSMKKTLRKLILLQMTVLHTKYKAENNGL